MKQKGFVYGYGEYCCIKMDHRLSARQVLKKAMDEGFSYMVKYVQIPGQKAWRRTLLGWNIKVLTLENALRATSDDLVKHQMVLHAASQGRQVFIKAPLKDGFEIFPAAEFDVVKILNSAEMAKL